MEIESKQLKIDLKASKAIGIYNYFKEIKFEDIERLALNSLSKGRYFKAMKEYKILNKERIKLQKKKELYSTISKKLLNLSFLTKINKNLKKTNESLLKLEKEFKYIQVSIDNEKFYEEISRINNLRDNIADRYFKQNNMFKEESKLNNFFIKETNKLKRDLESDKNISNRFTKISLKMNYINLRGKILGNYLVDFEIENKKIKNCDLDFF